MYLGGGLTLLLAPLWIPHLPPLASLAFGGTALLPGGIDGTTQMFGERESTNRLRGITGLFLGMGVVLFLFGVSRLLEQLLLGM